MSEAPKLTGSSCLVVDENGNDRETLRRVLMQAGADVVEATSAPRGLAEAARARNARRPFDLVFVAGAMSPIDGFEFAEHLQAHAKEFAGTIFVTDHSRHAFRDQSRLQALGLRAQLVKPLSREAIFAAIHQVRRAGEPLAPTRSSSPASPVRRKRILLAEDTTDVAWVIRAMVEGRGYEVDLATNGGIAADLYRMADYDLVLMDLMMPDFDGYWAAREIRKWEQATQRKPVPMIAVTAYVDETPDKAYAARFNDYLRKPFERPTLLRAIEQNLAHAR